MIMNDLKNKKTISKRQTTGEFLTEVMATEGGRQRLREARHSLPRIVPASSVTKGRTHFPMYKRKKDQSKRVNDSLFNNALYFTKIIKAIIIRLKF